MTPAGADIVQNAAFDSRFKQPSVVRVFKQCERTSLSGILHVVAEMAQKRCTSQLQSSPSSEVRFVKAVTPRQQHDVAGPLSTSAPSALLEQDVPAMG